MKKQFSIGLLIGLCVFVVVAAVQNFQNTSQFDTRGGILSITNNALLTNPVLKSPFLVGETISSDNLTVTNGSVSPNAAIGRFKTKRDTNYATVLMIGDSMSDEGYNEYSTASQLAKALRKNFGNAGEAIGGFDANYNPSFWSRGEGIAWFGEGKVVIYASDGTNATRAVQGTWFAPTNLVNRLGMYWVATNGGGNISFRVQNTAIGVDTTYTLDGYTAGANVMRYTNFPVTLDNRYSIYLTSIAGTNILAGPEFLRTNYSGVKVAWASRGGSTLTLQTNVGVGVLNSVGTNLNPDLIVYHAKDRGEWSTDAGMSNALFFMLTNIRGSTNCGIILVGTPPQKESTALLATTLSNNLVLKSVALAMTNVYYVDLFSRFPDWSRNNSSALMNGDTHPTLTGAEAWAQVIYQLSGFGTPKVFTGDASGLTNYPYSDFTSSGQTQLDGKQPLDSDLTAIATLTTTSFGRSLLTSNSLPSGSQTPWTSDIDGGSHKLTNVLSIDASTFNIGTINLTNPLGVASGGTGLSNLTSGTLLVGAGTNPPTLLSGGTVGNVVTWDGSTWASSTPSAGGNPFTAARIGSFIFDDLFYTVYTTTSPNGSLGLIKSIGNSGIVAQQVAETNAPGICRLTVAAVSSTAVLHNWTSGAEQFQIRGTFTNEIRFRLGWTNVPSSTNNIFFQAGFMDSNAGSDATDGAYLRYDTNNANFVLITAQNSVRTTNATDVLPATNTWYIARVVTTINASTTNAILTINDAHNVTNTANVPVGVRATSLGVGLKKVDGTDTITADVDYIGFGYGLEATR